MKLEIGAADAESRAVLGAPAEAHFNDPPLAIHQSIGDAREHCGEMEEPARASLRP